MTVTTAMSTTFKKDVLNGMHCFSQGATVTGTASSGAAAVTSVSSMTGIVAGMAVTGTNIAAGSVVATTDSSSSFTLSKVTTGAITGGSVTVSADLYYLALIKTSPGGTWDATAVNAGTLGSGSPTVNNLGTDEVTNTSGAAYVSGGKALTVTSATTSSTTAFIDFADISWTTASFSATGCLIYSQTKRGEGTANRIVSTHSFGDTTVAAGTFSLIFPTPDASNAIVRLS